MKPMSILKRQTKKNDGIYFASMFHHVCFSGSKFYSGTCIQFNGTEQQF